eukprot:scaffold1410_cov148-Isochrysis_galbana.AAC.6
MGTSHTAAREACRMPTRPSPPGPIWTHCVPASVQPTGSPPSRATTALSLSPLLPACTRHSSFPPCPASLPAPVRRNAALLG